MIIPDQLAIELITFLEWIPTPGTDEFRSYQSKAYVMRSHLLQILTLHNEAFSHPESKGVYHTPKIIDKVEIHDDVKYWGNE